VETVVHPQHERLVGDLEATLLAVLLLHHEAERRHQIVVGVIHQHSCTVNATQTSAVYTTDSKQRVDIAMN